MTDQQDTTEEDFKDGVIAFLNGLRGVEQVVDLSDSYDRTMTIQVYITGYGKNYSLIKPDLEDFLHIAVSLWRVSYYDLAVRNSPKEAMYVVELDLDPEDTQN